MAEEVDEKMNKIPTMQDNEKPKDLLQRFSQQQKPTKLMIKEEKNPEVNLGLSLGGIYCESSSRKSLPRSSSIIGTMRVNKKEDEDGEDLKPPLPKSFLSLTRSCSVLTEAEHEQRKASFIALAKKTFESAEGSSSRNMAQNGVVYKREKSPGPIPSSPSKVPAWAAASAAKSPALCRALLQIRGRASFYAHRNFEGKQSLVEQKVSVCPPSFPAQKHNKSNIMLWTSSNGKPESKVMLGTSSNGKPESKVMLGTSPNGRPESKVMLGTSSNGKLGSKFVLWTSSNVKLESKVMLGTSSNVKIEPKFMLATSSAIKPEYKVMLGASSNVKPESKVMLGTSSNGKQVRYAETMLQNPPKRIKLLNYGFQDTGMEVMRQMPSVTTIGDGPNGTKIEGFLYKYRKGQVSIVCVCHGSFLSPEEFVRHAGGIDVANPMRRITVCPTFY